MARPPSHTRWLLGVMTPASAAPDRGAGDLRQDRIEGRAPAVARHENGDVLLIRGPDPGPNRLAYGPCAEGRIGGPLNDLTEDEKVSSASTIPLSVLGLSTAGEQRNRCRQRKAVLGWTPQNSVVFTRLSPSIIAWARSSPRSFFRSRAIGVLVSALNVRPQPFAAKPRQTVRWSPGNNFAPRGAGSLGFHALTALPSERVRAKASRSAPQIARRWGGEPDSASSPKDAILPIPTFAKTAKACRRCPVLSRLISSSYHSEFRDDLFEQIARAVNSARRLASLWSAPLRVDRFEAAGFDRLLGVLFSNCAGLR